MNLNSIPLIGLLRGRLGYLNQRQELISQNIANADTPGYVGKDLEPFRPKSAHGGGAGPAPVVLAASGAGHIAAQRHSGQTFAAHDAPDSETTLDGNQVTLEDQMVKMAEARMDYDAAIGFYEKSLSMLRLAARRPGV